MKQVFLFAFCFGVGAEGLVLALHTGITTDGLRESYEMLGIQPTCAISPAPMR